MDDRLETGDKFVFNSKESILSPIEYGDRFIFLHNNEEDSFYNLVFYEVKTKKMKSFTTKILTLLKRD